MERDATDNMVLLSMSSHSSFTSVTHTNIGLRCRLAVRLDHATPVYRIYRPDSLPTMSPSYVPTCAHRPCL
jgi:hypothetical protein